MNSKVLLALISFALLTGCGIGGSLSQKEMDDLLSQAKVDIAAKQYADAEKKLLQCFHQADKNTQQHVRLAALNQLAELESARKNESKAKSYVWEAGAIGEELARTSSDNPEANEHRLLAEARKALLRWGDDYADVGHFDSAKTLYTKAQLVETRYGETVNPQDSADYRLKKLDERIRGEKQAIEHADGLVDEKDPRYHARIERTKSKRKLMEQMRLLNEEMVHKPGREPADKMLVVLDKILHRFGPREAEYRDALCTTIEFSFQFGNREKALALLKEDMAKYENIKQTDIERADPTTLENANFLISDLAQHAHLMTLTGNVKEAHDLSERGLKLAKLVKFHNCPAHSELYKAAAWSAENTQKFDEAIPLRRRQIEILETIRLTGNFPNYVDAHLELGRDLSAQGQPQESIKHLDYAVRHLNETSSNTALLAFAYQSKAEALKQAGDLSGARQCMLLALPLWQKNGNLEQKFGCYKAFGKISRSLNKRDEARKMDLKALDYCLQFQPKKQRQEAPDCYYEIALLESDDGHNKEAYDYLRHAYDAQLRVNGEKDFNAAGMLNFLAMLQARLGNNAEAEKLRLRAVEACRKTQETPRTPMVSTLQQLANFYQNSGQPEKAENPYREVIAIGAGINDPLAIQYVRMAKVQLAQVIIHKSKPEALKLKDEALAKLPSTNGSAANDGTYYTALGDLCLNLLDYTNGEKCYEEAEKIALACKPQLKNLQVTILTRKRDLYKATKREELMQKAEALLTGLRKASQAQ